jgi:hypothetical protein
MRYAATEKQREIDFGAESLYTKEEDGANNSSADLEIASSTRLAKEDTRWVAPTLAPSK